MWIPLWLWFNPQDTEALTPITASHTLKLMWVEIPHTLTWLNTESHRLGKGDRTKEIKGEEMVLF